ncbi:MAG: tetratricopeptide repeat protein [Alphaproteobacteria bacterium]|nr:tetratricopeptide repeat protein [Alphaproteobacteria bacterium]
MIRNAATLFSTGLLTCALLFAAAAFQGPARADQNDPRLDPLFEQLSQAQSPASARVLAGEIWRIWLDSGQDSINILMRQGVEAMNSGRTAEAAEAFDAMVELAPDFSEGWNKRATLRFYEGDFAGSIEDIKRTLALEPRHFGALSGLGMIYDALEEPEGALKAYQAAAEIHPFSFHAERRIEQITQELNDRRI